MKQLTQLDGKEIMNRLEIFRVVFFSFYSFSYYFHDSVWNLKFEVYLWIQCSFFVLRRLASSEHARNVEISPNTNKVTWIVLDKFDVFKWNSTQRWYYLYVRNSWRNIPGLRLWQCIGFCWQQWTDWHCVVVRRRCPQCLC